MRCGQVKCCGELIGWTAPGIMIKCPRCGKLATAKTVARLPGYDAAANKKAGKAWRAYGIEDGK